MKRLLALLVLAAFPASAQMVMKRRPMYVLDTTAPEAISDLAASGPTSSSCLLSWTAPHQDGASGGAVSAYDCRVCPQATCSTTMDDTEYTSSATALSGEPPIPGSPGSSESFTASGLSPSTDYVFACKSSDAASNVSAISNSATCSTVAGGFWAEDFDGSTTCFGSNTCDHAWTKAVAGTNTVMDADSVACGTHTGFSGQCLHTVLTADSSERWAEASTDLGSQYATLYTRFFISIPAVNWSSGDAEIIYNGCLAGCADNSNAFVTVKIVNVGAQVKLRALSPNGGGYSWSSGTDTVNVAAGDVRCVEVMIANTAGTDSFAWRVGDNAGNCAGSDTGSGSGTIWTSGSDGVELIWLGLQYATGASTETGTFDFDGVAASTTGWLGN